MSTYRDPAAREDIACRRAQSGPDGPGSLTQSGPIGPVSPGGAYAAGTTPGPRPVPAPPPTPRPVPHPGPAPRPGGA